ncbi:MAG: RagB/SusD family nutrient uptake outer membrane protein [Dysgonamonadaceae bacterium]|jgi:hypothetical protein|nr:RagB/SusD family nutrient uptake outer membrane protein [Dysgonamonadaceae bacterium]
MKSQYYLYTLLIAALTFTSCNDWLDVAPKTEMDQEELFKTETGFGDLLIGVYSNLCDPALYGRNMTFNMFDLIAGYYGSGGGVLQPRITQYGYKKQYATNSVYDITPMVDEIWTGLYKQIANLNSMLAVIDDYQDVFSGDNYRLFKGEAIGLRAFLHFELLRMFGQPYATGRDSLCIPIVKELGAFVTPLSTVDEAATLILADLVEAKELLTSDPMYLGTTPSKVITPPLGCTNEMNSWGVYDWHNRRMNFNYYAVIGTMARLYQWKGDKANALAAVKEIIEVQPEKFNWVINSNLTGISSGTAYAQDRTFTTEHLFALNMQYLEDYTDSYLVLKTSSWDVTEVLDITNSLQQIYEGLTADPRLQYNTAQLLSRRVCSKYWQPEEAGAFFKNRMAMIRLSEMYYIAAEASPTPVEGVAYLNEVRTHRGLSALPTSISADELQEEILKEYRKELICEGQLWFYYKRHLFPTIPNLNNGNTMTYFVSTSYYTFNRPDIEDSYGGR